MGGVHGPPSLLGGLDELEDHGQRGGRAAGTPGDLRSQADGGKGRLACDYETLTVSSEAMIHLASIDNLTKRITDETTPTWRGTY